MAPDKPEVPALMVAVLDVDLQAGGWRADVVQGDDRESIDRPPSEQKWMAWLAPAIEWQAMRGGGIFVAVAPL